MLDMDKIRALRAKIEKAVQSLTDEESLECVCLHPKWSGDGVSYTAGLKVQYEDTLYTVLQTHISQPDWTPKASPSLFAEVLVSDDGTPLPWVQPESTNGYMTGDRVIFEGSVYESKVDNNVWSPSAYPAGWELVES